MKAVPPTLTLSERFGRWLMRRVPNDSPLRKAPSQSDADDAGEGLRLKGPPGWWLRFFSPGAALNRYRHLEEWSWQTDSKKLQNLAWLLRTKCEESNVSARAANRMGLLMTVGGTLVSGAGVVATYFAWKTIVGLVQATTHVLPDKVIEKVYAIPDHLWIIVVATSGALLLVGGASTLLFRVARQFYERSLQHAKEANYTRQIETAVRVVLSVEGYDSTKDVNDALRDLALRLLHREPDGKASAVAEELSAVPDGVRELLQCLVNLKVVKD
jgi:hypothetical protein